MKLPNFSVERPVTTLMIFLGVILLGVISWTRLPQELFPAMTYPKLSIVTIYENAAPEEVETLITKIIEEGAGTVSGVKRLSSTSKEGMSFVVVEFEWGTSMEFAALAVREKVDLVKERLPIDSGDPLVVKYNPFELPVMVLSVTGKESPADLREYSKKYIKERLEKIDGVASAAITGGVERQILIELDQAKLQAHKVPITRFVEVLRRSNVNYPAGSIEEDFYEYLIRTIGEFETVKEIGNVVVGVEELNIQKRSEKLGISETYLSSLPGSTGEGRNRFIKLSDVGTIKDTFKEKTSISRFNGRDNISIAALKQAGGNTIQVADRIHENLERIRKEIPKNRDITITVAYDQSVFIRESISGVRDSALQGGVLVFLVLIFFLRNLKSSWIVTTSIPVSIMAALSMMYFSGISINMMSLMGLALGIGMLVDNAIVVMENIFNKLQEGASQNDAARDGANEMGNAITSSTLTSVCVFAPMVFVKGVAGQLFKELALTVTFSLIASLVVALSLIPRLMSGGASDTSKKRHKKPKKAFSSFEMKAFSTRYARILPICLKRRWVFLVGVIIFGALSCLLVVFIDTEFMPKVDEGKFIVKVTLPTGTRLVVTDRVVTRIEETFFGHPAIKDVAVTMGSSRGGGQDFLETMGSHQGQIIVSLKNTDDFSTPEVVHELQEKIKKLELEHAEVEFIVQGSALESAMQGSSPVVIEVKGKDIPRLETMAKDLQRMLLGIEGITESKTSLTLPHPEVKVNISKDKAAYHHLSVQDIAVTAHTAMKGIVATKFKDEGDEIDVFIRLKESDRKDLSKLRKLLIATPMDTEVPLAEVAYLTKGVGPSQVERLSQQRVVFVMADIADRSLNDILDDVAKGITRYRQESLTKDERETYTMEITGERQQMADSFKSLQFALILSVLLVYMIMASQFESLWQPFVIMMTLPLSGIGVIWILVLTQTPVSVVVILGVIVLGGIVVNNGIVLIDSINELRRHARMGLEDAIVQASQNRLRPIFMTTLTTVFGWLPMAFSKQLIAPLAVTVMGGLTLSTFLTLLVIPVIYYAVARHRPEMTPVDDSFAAVSGDTVAEAGDTMPSASETDESIVAASQEVPPAEASPPETSLPLLTPQQESLLDIRENQKQIETGCDKQPTSAVEDTPEEIDQAQSVEEPVSPGDNDEETLSHQPTDEQKIDTQKKEALPKDDTVTGDRPLIIQSDETVISLPDLSQPEESITDDATVADEGASPEIPLRSKEDIQRDTDEVSPGTADNRSLPEVPDNTASSSTANVHLLPRQPDVPLSSDDTQAEKDEAFMFNKRQQAFLELLKEKKRLTRKEYADIFKVSVPTAARDLKELLTKGRVQAKGPLGPGRWYELVIAAEHSHDSSISSEGHQTPLDSHNENDGASPEETVS